MIRPVRLPHPQERPGECAAALLAEIARDYFPGRFDEPGITREDAERLLASRAAISPGLVMGWDGTPEDAGSLLADDAECRARMARRDILDAAGATMAAFADALMSGRHGPGCIAQKEEDAADERNLLGFEPYCADCGAAVHLFRDMTGWHHYRGRGTARSPLEIIDPGHKPALSWRRPGACAEMARSL